MLKQKIYSYLRGLRKQPTQDRHAVESNSTRWDLYSLYHESFYREFPIHSFDKTKLLDDFDYLLIQDAYLKRETYQELNSIYETVFNDVIERLFPSFAYLAKNLDVAYWHPKKVPVSREGNRYIIRENNILNKTRGYGKDFSLWDDLLNRSVLPRFVELASSLSRPSPSHPDFEARLCEDHLFGYAFEVYDRMKRITERQFDALEQKITEQNKTISELRSQVGDVVEVARLREEISKQHQEVVEKSARLDDTMDSLKGYFNTIKTQNDQLLSGSPKTPPEQDTLNDMLALVERLKKP